jgi:GT2 family glycosyltransferase
MPRVSAVVLNYNGRELLQVILPSLAAQAYRDFEIVVVDNGSSDDSESYLQEDWPQVRVVSTGPVNIGVSAALNVAIGAATGEFVALLNNDIELDPGWMGELVAALERHPEAGTAVGKLLNFYRRGELDGAGDVFSWGGEVRRRGYGEPDRGQYEQPQAIFGACGGAALYRGSALAAVGPIDEALYAYYEDADWSFRAQLRGYRCRYVPAAVAYHMGSATLGAGPSDFNLYQAWRNSIWVVLKNYPALDLLRHAPALLFVQLRNLAIAVRRRRGLLWLRVWRDALRGLPAVLHKRREVQRSRRIARRELNAVIERVR